MRRKLEKTILMHGGNISLVTSVIVLVAFAAGLLVGTLVIAKVYGVNKLSSIALPMTGGYADGWNAAKAKLALSNPMMSNVFSLSGKIAAINGKEISFSAALVNPLDDESLKSRVAVIDDKTKITVWKLKSADQAAKDQKEAQASLTSLQKKNETLRAALNVCDKKRMEAAPAAGTAGEESADCLSARADFIASMKAISDAMQKIDVYEKIDNAALSDIKAGWNITATSLAIKTGGDENNSLPGLPQRENISSKQKFIAGSIDVKEVIDRSAGASASAPIAAPAAPIK